MDEDTKAKPERTPAHERLLWKNRTEMAWTALAAMLVVTAAVLTFVSVERLAVLEEVITWFFFSMATIVAAYFGFTTWASKNNKNDKFNKYE